MWARIARAEPQLLHGLSQGGGGLTASRVDTPGCPHDRAQALKAKACTAAPESMGGEEKAASAPGPTSSRSTIDAPARQQRLVRSLHPGTWPPRGASLVEGSSCSSPLWEAFAKLIPRSTDTRSKPGRPRFYLPPSIQDKGGKLHNSLSISYISFPRPNIKFASCSLLIPLLPVSAKCHPCTVCQASSAPSSWSICVSRLLDLAPTPVRH